MNIQKLDQKAKYIAEEYKKSEVKLIEVLEELDQHKAYYKLGYPSLFKYCTDALKLSPEVTAIYINVARKTREVPRLKEAIKTGSITVSKARRMTSVLNKKNQDHWIQMASTCSKQKLEREVAMASPKTAVREQLSYVAASNEIKEKASVLQLDSKDVRVQLQVGMSEKNMLKLRRAQEVLSQKRMRPVSLEECLETMTELFLIKSDPLEIAKRQKVRGKLYPAAKKKGEIKAESSARKAVELEINDALAKNTVPGHSHNASHTNKIIAMDDKNQSKIKAYSKNKIHNYKRKPLTAHVKHQVQLKYKGQCGYKELSGKTCNNKSFLEIHHRVPVHQGGNNSLENLILLCQGHHKMQHLV